MNDDNLTFQYLNELEFRHRLKDGEPISDFRIVAGLLFRRWNDGTTRYVRYRKYSKTSTLYIRHPNGGNEFQVLNECVDTLDDLAMLDKSLVTICDVGLSLSGSKTVVHDWFGSSASVLDRIATTVSERY